MRLIRWVGAIYCGTVLCCTEFGGNASFAAGKTYKSSKDEEKPEYEICRLKELLREEKAIAASIPPKREEKSSLKLTIALYAKLNSDVKKNKFIHNLTTPYVVYARTGYPNRFLKWYIGILIEPKIGKKMLITNMREKRSQRGRINFFI